jgi:hypothetical protein
MAEEDKLLMTSDWLRELNAPFFRLSGFVPLIENCSVLLEYTSRISFETPSAIVPLRCVMRLEAKLVSLIRLPCLLFNQGLDLINSKKVWNRKMVIMDLH